MASTAAAAMAFQKLLRIAAGVVHQATSSCVKNGWTIEVPHSLESLDHEVELAAVVIGQKATAIGLRQRYSSGSQVVGPVSVGQQITASMTGLLDIHFDDAIV